MSTYVESTGHSTTGWPLYAALGAGVSVVLAAVGTLWDVNGNDSSGAGTFTDFLIVVGVIAMATALVFGLMVRPATPNGAGVRSIVLAVLSLLSLVAFWAGLPAVLAAGACACAVISRREDGSLTAIAKTSLAISAGTLAIAIFAAITG